MDKRKKTLAEINHWCKTTTILIVNEQGLLKVISVPFKVILICEIEEMDFGAIVAVEAVKTTVELVPLYVIGNKPYPYFLFVILFDE